MFRYLLPLFFGCQFTQAGGFVPTTLPETPIRPGDHIRIKVFLENAETLLLGKSLSKDRSEIRIHNLLVPFSPEQLRQDGDVTVLNYRMQIPTIANEENLSPEIFLRGLLGQTLLTGIASEDEAHDNFAQYQFLFPDIEGLRLDSVAPRIEALVAKPVRPGFGENSIMSDRARFTFRVYEADEVRHLDFIVRGQKEEFSKDERARFSRAFAIEASPICGSKGAIDYPSGDAPTICTVEVALPTAVRNMEVEITAYDAANNMGVTYFVWNRARHSEGMKEEFSLPWPKSEGVYSNNPFMGTVPKFVSQEGRLIRGVLPDPRGIDRIRLEVNSRAFKLHFARYHLSPTFDPTTGAFAFYLPAFLGQDSIFSLTQFSREQTRLHAKLFASEINLHVKGVHLSAEMTPPIPTAVVIEKIPLPMQW